MPSSVRVPNIAAALGERLLPTITTFNRIEGRPRSRGFERALQAEIRDPLWMLAKQWQMGEFRGSDAGSPVFVKLQVDTTELTKYRPDAGPTQSLGYGTSLEATVEQRTIPLTLDIRLVMGRRWLSLIDGVGSYRKAFIDAYPILPPDPTDESDAARCAHPDVWQAFAAVAGRAMDGGSLYAYLVDDPAHHAFDGISVAPGDEAAIDDRAAKFIAWFNRTFFQPGAGENAWLPEQLEYRFAVSTPTSNGERVYVADEYYQGQLDWYNLDLDPSIETLGAISGAVVTNLPPAEPRTMIPTAVSFAGMPNRRWWAFEDARTNFGDIDASTTDLAKLLYMEFALVYANDWFIVPFTVPAGTIASVRGCSVTNVFGERFWIEAPNQGADGTSRAWSMFTINVQGARAVAADPSLLTLQVFPKIQESPPTEEVMLVRDEVANMVWGIEKLVPMATGWAKPGSEAADEFGAYQEAFAAAASPEPTVATAAAPIRYRAMSTIPENWIPFIPVHRDSSNREIQLQRAALPRILPGRPTVKIRPRTVLLSEGLGGSSANAYFLHEEEVPRAGIRLTRSYQRTRSIDGRVFTWLGIRKQTGRGEASSGLNFDEVVPTG